MSRGVWRLAAVVLAPVLFTSVVFPVGLSYVYTHVGGKALTPDVGVPYESVRFPASDGIELSATYVPSENRAAVVLFPGSARSDEARMPSGTATACCSSTHAVRAGVKATSTAGPATAT